LPAVARVLILGGGCRGRQLAAGVLRQGHAVRIVTRREGGREAIEGLGAECFIGDPNRLGTLRGVLEGVTVACWLLSTAGGAPEELRELNVSRLPAFLASAIDSTMRGFVFEAPAEGAGIVRDLAARNAVEAMALSADPRETGLWLAQAREALAGYL
jgi:uncharacterized protein YbjT (DUF2867 family)